MIISAKIINRPRKQRRCETCRTPIEGETLRLYGAAEIGDPPWTIYLHPACGSKEAQQALRNGKNNEQ